MTATMLAQSATSAIEQAAQFILTGCTDTEAVLNQLNEARECTEKLMVMINPPLVPKPVKAECTLRSVVCKEFGIGKNEIFTKTRKREVVNARQVWTYCVMSTKVPNKGPIGSSKVMRYIGWDHATHLHSCKTVEGFISTEKQYQVLIPRLLEGVRSGKYSVPEIPDMIEEEAVISIREVAESCTI